MDINKIAAILGTILPAIFLIGLATTLTKSRLIGFFDVLPVYIIMGMALIMMVVELKSYFDDHK
jgi:hypothetical protein